MVIVVLVLPPHLVGALPAHPGVVGGDVKDGVVHCAREAPLLLPLLLQHGDALHSFGQSEDVAEGDAGVDDVEEGDLDLDWEAGRKAARDEVLQLLEVRVGDGHEVYDGHDLLLQGQRELLAQPQLRLELLHPARHFPRTPDVPPLQVRLGVKVLVRGDAAGVVDAVVLGRGLLPSRPPADRLLDLHLGHAQEGLQRVLVALGPLLVFLREVLGPRLGHQLDVVRPEHLAVVPVDGLALLRAAPPPEAAAATFEVDLVSVEEGKDERGGETSRDLVV